MAVKGGRGGSLLKDLKVLQRSQRPKTNSVLKADNDQDRIVSAEDKLERWRRHFGIATYVPTEITESSLGHLRPPSMEWMRTLVTKSTACLKIRNWYVCLLSGDKGGHSPIKGTRRR